MLRGATVLEAFDGQDASTEFHQFHSHSEKAGFVGARTQSLALACTQCGGFCPSSRKQHSHCKPGGTTADATDDCVECLMGYGSSDGSGDHIHRAHCCRHGQNLSQALSCIVRIFVQIFEALLNLLPHVIRISEL